MKKETTKKRQLSQLLIIPFEFDQYLYDEDFFDRNWKDKSNNDRIKEIDVFLSTLLVKVEGDIANTRKCMQYLTKYPNARFNLARTDGYAIEVDMISRTEERECCKQMGLKFELLRETPYEPITQNMSTAN